MSTVSRPCTTLFAILALAAAAVLLLPALVAATPRTAAANGYESYVIKSDGTLWAWGGNAFGGIGIGDTLPRELPVQVGSATTWKSIASDNSLGTVALRQDGTLWHWGDYGIPFTVAPVQYTGDPAWAGPWEDYAAGDMHLLLLKNGSVGARELYAWGGNEWGMLGNGTSGSSAGSSVPIRIGDADLWRSVAAGYGHSLAVKSDGSLWAWGLNDNGQLGLGHTDNKTEPTRVGAASDWASVYCGSHSSYAVNTSGRLFAWGYNEFGQLGVGDKAEHLAPAQVGGTGWDKVSPGPLDCLAVKGDGTLWSWGYNVNGQLGLPADYKDHLTPTRVGTATTWKDVACGPYHTVAVTEPTPGTNDDKFAACGSNHYGQIGLGFPLYRCSPEKIGTTAGWLQVDASLTHGAGVRDDFSLWTWGYDIDGALGGSGGLTAPARVGFDNDWGSVAAGAYTDSNYTMAIKKNGTLWAFGGNASGQLGLGDKESRSAPTQVGLGTDWKVVACSDGVGDRGRQRSGDPYTLDDHTLAIKADGSLWAWGANDHGQLGLGSAGAADELTPVRVGSGADWAAVAAGDDYSAALKTNGTLWTWGRGQFGQLGHGSKAAVAVPTQVTTGSGVDTFTAFACGSGRDSSHMLAVKTDGSLWGWGYQSSGELGQGLVIDYYLSPVRIGSDSDWSTVACGSSYGDNYSLATKTGGQLYAWGGNFRGQLGGGDYVVRFDVGAAGGGGSAWAGVVAGSNSFGLRTDGTLWAWGDNEWGQLGLGDAKAYSSTTVFPLAEIVDTTAPTVETTVSKPAPAAVAAATPGAASSRAGDGWTRTPRTIKVTATDTGAGVGRAQISLTGGVSYMTRTSVTVRNGDAKVYVRAIDRKGNTSAPKYLGRWKVDTTKPEPAALNATVKRGSTAKLKYRIADYSPCTVKIAVKNARGATVKTISLKGRRPMSWQTAGFRCTLAKGTYRFFVSATDSVGYKQIKAAVGKLVVK
jgi:alpha-tubulin suppressor-like RCC1 family protein